MSGMKRYLLLFLSLCLLAGCGERGMEKVFPTTTETPAAAETGPEPTPVLTLEPEPELPGEALALLDLEEGEWVMDRAAGDLNGDGFEDWVVVIEGPPEEGREEEYPQAGPRILTILLGDGEGGYTQGQSNDRFVRRADQGGTFGDPYEGIQIEDGELEYSAYGGSSWRWWDTYRFSWQGDGLTLKTAEYISYSCVTEGLGGEQTHYDFSTGEYTLRAWCGGGGDMDGKLLWREPLSMTAPRLEELPNVDDEGEPWVETPPLPSLGRYEYGAASLYAPARHSPEDLLDKAKKEHHPDMWRVDIPWTGETRANYSAVMGCEAPGYYYTDGQAVLYYNGLEVQGEDLRPYRHSIWYKGKDYRENWEASEIYWYLDETGEEWGTED